MKIYWTEENSHYDLPLYYIFDVMEQQLILEKQTEEGVIRENLNWTQYTEVLRNQIQDSIRELRSKIFNNREVIHSLGREQNEMGLKKAENHMRQNQEQLLALQTFLEQI